MQPVWERCPVCAQIELLEDAGPPGDGKGYHIVLVTREEAIRREEAKYD